MMNAKKYVPNRLRGVFSGDDKKGSSSPSTRLTSSSSRAKKSRPWRVDAASWKQQLQERKAVYDNFALPEKTDEEKEVAPQMTAKTEELEAIPLNVLTSTTAGGGGQVETMLTPNRGGQVETVFTSTSKGSSSLSSTSYVTENGQADDKTDSRFKNNPRPSSLSPSKKNVERKSSPLPRNRKALKSSTGKDGVVGSKSRKGKKKTEGASPHRMKRIDNYFGNNGSSNKEHDEDASRSAESCDSTEYFVDGTELMSSKSKDSNVGIVNGIAHVKNQVKKNKIFRPNVGDISLPRGGSDDTAESIGFPYGEEGKPDTPLSKSSMMEAVEEFIDISKIDNEFDPTKRRAKSNYQWPSVKSIEEITNESKTYIDNKDEIKDARSSIFVHESVGAEITASDSPNRREGRRRQLGASPTGTAQLSPATSTTSTTGTIMGNSYRKGTTFRSQKSPECNNYHTKSTNQSTTQALVCGRTGGLSGDRSINPTPSDEDICLDKSRLPSHVDADNASTSSGDTDINSVINDVTIAPLTSNRKSNKEIEIDLPPTSTPDPLQKARKTLLVSNLNRSVRSLLDSSSHSRKDDDNMGDSRVENASSKTIFVPLRSRRQSSTSQSESTKETPLNVLDNHGVYASKYNSGIYVPPNSEPVQPTTEIPQGETSEEIYNKLGAYVPQDKAASLLEDILRDDTIPEGEDLPSVKNISDNCVSTSLPGTTETVAKSLKFTSSTQSADDVIKECKINTSGGEEVVENNLESIGSNKVVEEKECIVMADTQEEGNHSEGRASSKKQLEIESFNSNENGDSENLHQDCNSSSNENAQLDGKNNFDTKHDCNDIEEKIIQNEAEKMPTASGNNTGEIVKSNDLRQEGGLIENTQVDDSSNFDSNHNCDNNETKTTQYHSDQTSTLSDNEIGDIVKSNDLHHEDDVDDTNNFDTKHHCNDNEQMTIQNDSEQVLKASKNKIGENVNSNSLQQEGNLSSTENAQVDDSNIFGTKHNCDNNELMTIQNNSDQSSTTSENKIGTNVISNDVSDGDSSCAVDEIDANRIRLISDLKRRVKSIYTGNHICVESIGTSVDPDPLATLRRKREAIKKAHDASVQNHDLKIQLNDTVSALNTDHHYVIESSGNLNTEKGKKWKERMAMKKLSKKNEKSNQSLYDYSDDNKNFAHEGQPIPIKSVVNDSMDAAVVEKLNESAEEEMGDENLIEHDEMALTIDQTSSAKILIEELKVGKEMPSVGENDENYTKPRDSFDGITNGSQDESEEVADTNIIRNTKNIEVIESIGRGSSHDNAGNTHGTSEELMMISTSKESENIDISTRNTDYSVSESTNDLPDETKGADVISIMKKKPGDIDFTTPDTNRDTTDITNELPNEGESINPVLSENEQEQLDLSIQDTDHDATGGLFDLSREPKNVNAIISSEKHEKNHHHTKGDGLKIVDDVVEQSEISKSQFTKLISDTLGEENSDALDHGSNTLGSAQDKPIEQSNLCVLSNSEITKDAITSTVDTDGDTTNFDINDEDHVHSTNLPIPTDDNNIIQGLPPNKGKKWKDRLEKKKNKKSDKNEASKTKDKAEVGEVMADNNGGASVENKQESDIASSEIKLLEDSMKFKNSKDRPSFNRNLSDLTAEEKQRAVSPSDEAQPEPPPKILGKKSNKWKNRLARIKGSKQENTKPTQLHVKPERQSDTSDRGQILVDFKRHDTSLPSTSDRGQILVDFKQPDTSSSMKLELPSGTSDRGQILLDFKSPAKPTSGASEVADNVQQPFKETSTTPEYSPRAETLTPTETSTSLNQSSASEKDVSKVHSSSKNGSKIQDSKIHQNLLESFDVFDAFLQNGHTNPTDDESLYTEMTIGQESMMQSGIPGAQRCEEEQSYMDFTLEESIQPSFVEQTAAPKTTPKEQMMSPFMTNLMGSRMFQNDVPSIPKMSMPKEQEKERGREEKQDKQDKPVASPNDALKKFPTITVEDAFDDDMTQITMGSLDEDLNKVDDEQFFDAEANHLPRSPSSKSIGKKSKFSMNSRKSESVSSHSSQPSCSETSKQRIVEILRKEVWSRDNNVVQSAMKELGTEAGNGHHHRAHIVRCGGVMTIMRAMEMNSNCSAIQIASCSTLEKLALDPQTQMAICEMEGISLIVRSMQVHFEVVELQEAACVALATICRHQEGSASKDSMKDAEEAVPTLLSCMTRYPTKNCIQAKGFQAIANLCSGSHAHQRLEELSKAGGIMTLTMALQTPWENKNDQHEAISSLSILLRGITELNEQSLSVPTGNEASKDLKRDEISGTTKTKESNFQDEITSGGLIADSETVASYMSEIPDMPMMSTVSINGDEIPDLDAFPDEFPDEFPTEVPNLEWQNFGEDDLDAGRKESLNPSSPETGRQGEAGKNHDNEEQCIIQ